MWYEADRVRLAFLALGVPAWHLGCLHGIWRTLAFGVPWHLACLATWGALSEPPCQRPARVCQSASRRIGPPSLTCCCQVAAYRLTPSLRCSAPPASPVAVRPLPRASKRPAVEKGEAPAAVNRHGSCTCLLVRCPMMYILRQLHNPLSRVPPASPGLTKDHGYLKMRVYPSSQETPPNHPHLSSTDAYPASLSTLLQGSPLGRLTGPPIRPWLFASVRRSLSDPLHIAWEPPKPTFRSGSWTVPSLAADRHTLNALPVLSALDVTS